MTAVLLRRNRASARFWLWLAASVKFLIPISALVAVGGALQHSAPQRIVAIRTVAPGVAAMATRINAPLPAATSQAVDYSRALFDSSGLHSGAFSRTSGSAGL